MSKRKKPFSDSQKEDEHLADVTNFFSEVEYVDPDEDRCEECGSSFGVHLMKCSKFVRKS